MKTLKKIVVIVAGLASAMAGAGLASAQPVAPTRANNVVLVHGAWADGS